MARPRISPDPTVRITIRLGSRDSERLGALAASRGLSEAEAARVAIVAWLNTNELPKSEGFFGVEGEGGPGQLVAPGVVTPANPSHPEPVEAEVEGADAPVGEDRASVDPVPPPSLPEPDDKPPLTRPKTPIPKAAKNVDDVAAQLAARAKQREPEHVHRPVARKGSVNPGCAGCSMIKIGQNWIQPETADVPDDEDW